MLHFNLFGPFSLFDEDGIDRRPKLMKSKAILAVLAALPGHRHSRSWFQNLLWEDRQHEQGQSSLRSALSDIRRHLGPYSHVLTTSHSEISLDPAMVAICDGGPNGATELLEGFDIANANNFEDWLREMRAHFQDVPPRPVERPFAQAQVKRPVAEVAPTFFLASRSGSTETMTRMQCDLLVDSIVKSLDDLGLAETVDGRGRGSSMDDFLELAAKAGCSHLLISETAEGPSGAIARLKVVEIQSGRIDWSKSATGPNALDVNDPATIGIVAEFIDVLAHRLIRDREFDPTVLPPSLIAAVGINSMFRLGGQNYETADDLLRTAHRLEPKGRYLAWRAYLRTLVLGELEYCNRESIIEEGSSFARRALEDEPHNSMVLAICSQVENMMHNSYQNAFELASQALELNRCNPMAWTSLGAATAFLDEPTKGQKFAQIGARLSAGSNSRFKSEAWASAASLLAGDLRSARIHAEISHEKAPSFAPPLRYLSALYCADGRFDLAQQAADKLRLREPGFTLERLRDDGYPSDSLRQANLVSSLPSREI